MFLAEVLAVQADESFMKKDGKFERTPEGVCVSPNFPGYDERYYRAIVEDTGDHLRVKEFKK